jgi:LCP family protein required for cell wall assembly
VIPDATSRKRASRPLALTLSFLWPGLGQLYAGHRLAAAGFAGPLVVVVLVVFVQAIVGGLGQLAGLLLVPSSALAILLLTILLGAWRLLAMTHAVVRSGDGPWWRGRTRGLFVALTLVVVLVHGWTSYVAWSFLDASTRIFSGDLLPPAGDDPFALGPGPEPSDPFPSGDLSGVPVGTLDPASPEPIHTPATNLSRINVLLFGLDSGPGRNHALTDTLMVASIDPASRKVAMISVPRDVSQFRLYNGRTYPGKINSLMTAATRYPQLYPDGPVPTVMKQVGYIVGLPIQYFAAVDMTGFPRLVDAMGGVTVNVERAINDPNSGFRLPAGVQTLDGKSALSYAQSRFSAGDNDFTRARRQQLLLIALRDKLASPAMLPKIPGLIQLGGNLVRTNFPTDRIGEMLQLAALIDRSSITQVVLQPPTYTYHPPTDSTDGIYTLRLIPAAIASLSVELFGQDSAFWTGPAPSPTGP